jgi:outer membrane translocation and assembly module TamA
LGSKVYVRLVHRKLLLTTDQFWFAAFSDIGLFAARAVPNFADFAVATGCAAMVTVNLLS